MGIGERREARRREPSVVSAPDELPPNYQWTNFGLKLVQFRPAQELAGVCAAVKRP